MHRKGVEVMIICSLSRLKYKQKKETFCWIMEKGILFEMSGVKLFSKFNILTGHRWLSVLCLCSTIWKYCLFELYLCPGLAWSALHAVTKTVNRVAGADICLDDPIIQTRLIWVFDILVASNFKQNKAKY